MFKRLVIIAIGLLLCAAVLTYTSGIEGEVFLVSKDGRAMPAVGSRVRVLEDAGETSRTRLFQTVQEPLMQNLTKRLDGHMSEISRSNGDSTELSIINERIQRDQDWFCRQIEFELIKHSNKSVADLFADRNGRFRLRTLPGSYVIWVSGQAGVKKAVWIEQAKLTWRSEARIVEPVCEQTVE